MTSPHSPAGQQRYNYNDAFDLTIGEYITQDRPAIRAELQAAGYEDVTATVLAGSVAILGDNVSHPHTQFDPERPRTEPANMPSDLDIARHLDRHGPTLGGLVTAAVAMENRERQRPMVQQPLHAARMFMRNRIMPQVLTERIGGRERVLRQQVNRVIAEAYGRDQVRNDGDSAAPLLWALACGRAAELMQGGNGTEEELLGTRLGLLAASVAEGFAYSWDLNAGYVSTYPRALAELRTNIDIANRRLAAHQRRMIQRRLPAAETRQQQRQLTAQIGRVVTNFRGVHMANIIAPVVGNVHAERQTAEAEKRRQTNEKLDRQQDERERAQQRDIAERDSSIAYNQRFVDTPVPLMVENVRAGINLARMDPQADLGEHVLSDAVALDELTAAGEVQAPLAHAIGLPGEPLVTEAFRHINDLANGTAPVEVILFADRVSAAAVHPDYQRHVQALKRALATAALLHYGFPEILDRSEAVGGTADSAPYVQALAEGSPPSRQLLRALVAGFAFEVARRGVGAIGTVSPAMYQRLINIDTARNARLHGAAHGVDEKILPGSFDESLAAIRRWQSIMSRHPIQAIMNRTTGPAAALVRELFEKHVRRSNPRRPSTWV